MGAAGCTGANPVIWQGTLAQDGATALAPGTYCFRVRARSDRAAGNVEVWGDYTYLQDGNTDSASPVGPAFTWTDYPDPTDPANSAGCNTTYLLPDDYRSRRPARSTAHTLLHLARVTGAQSYFVVVAKDPSFGNVVDEAFTWVPAYSPRNSTGPTTYTDETTKYYWAVLPSAAFDGSRAPALDSSLTNPGNFKKQSLPPTLLYPAAAQTFPDQPSFRWTATEGARRYRLQISSDATFSNLLDDV